MSEYASSKDPGEGTVFEYNDVWDSDMIFGCKCDDGFTGPDCMSKLCPTGDDPLTGTSADPAGQQYNEIQKVQCTATGGTFTLSFQQKTTKPIPYNANSAAVSTAINALPSVAAIHRRSQGGSNAVVSTPTATVTFSDASGTACSSDGSQTFTVEFTQNFGDIPLLVPGTSLLTHTTTTTTPSVLVTELTKGSKENDRCSNRGVCDILTGICTCNLLYDTSNGAAGIGTQFLNRGDCGYVTSTITNCPGEVVCSGHGVCAGSPTYRCNCAEGWTGSDCSERQCPFHQSWFDYPSATGTAHARAECSGAGLCDRSKGTCQCSTNFEGSACERQSCPGTPTCSGHGQCLTMQLLAERRKVDGNTVSKTYGSTPNSRMAWDFDKIQGCLCDESFTGYDCSERLCPFGDDPYTQSGVHEVQAITCRGTTGFFSLRFRDVQTEDIKFTATEAEVEAALERLPSIGDVAVKFSKKTEANTTADKAAADVMCTALGDNICQVTFLTELGNVPQIEGFRNGVSKLFIAPFDTVHSNQGSKENVECSNRGLCDRTTGICNCFPGYGSSDGHGKQGTRGDCGYIHEMDPRATI